MSRRSEVARLWELVPASASVIAKAIFVVPPPIPRSQRSFWAVGPVPGQDAPHDRWRDHDQQQRAAGRGDLLTHPRKRRHPQATPVVLLGNVDAQISARGQRLPQLARRFPSVALALHVVAAKAAADSRHGLTEQGLLLRGHERQGSGGGSGRHSRRSYGSALAVERGHVVARSQSRSANQTDSPLHLARSRSLHQKQGAGARFPCASGRWRRHWSRCCSGRIRAVSASPPARLSLSEAFRRRSRRRRISSSETTASLAFQQSPTL